MSNKTERMAVHNLWVPDTYLPQPEAHLTNPRDRQHYLYTKKLMAEESAKSLLDVGCWDGWLGFLLIKEGFEVSGVEIVPGLASAVARYAQKLGVSFPTYVGFLDDVKISRKFDVVSCYETLEHLWPIDSYVRLLESLSQRIVTISLPNQRHEDNQPQHLWTPTLEKIHDWWGSKPNFSVEYCEYPGTAIPGNWFIKYSV